MNYKLLLISALIAIAAIPLAHANFPLGAPMGIPFFWLMGAILTTIFVEVGVVIVLLRKKSLKNLTLLLFLTNIISFILFLVILPTLTVLHPNEQIFLSEALVIIFEARVLSGATKQSFYLEPEGLPLSFKSAFVPVLIGNIVSIVLGGACLHFLSQYFNPPTVARLTEVEISISGQGTWETTLEARDFDGDNSTIEGYYDTVLGITWLKDANYAETIGDHTNRRMKWPEANAWAAHLDINGVTGWRLPTLNPINGVTFDGIYANNATTDYGFALTTTDGTDGGWRDSAGNPASEMGHMYYVTLGNIAHCSPDYNDRCIVQPGSGLSNTGPFSNVQNNSYWADLETGDNIDYAWLFGFSTGKQGAYDGIASAWAVHDGDVGTPIFKSSASTE